MVIFALFVPGCSLFQYGYYLLDLNYTTKRLTGNEEISDFVISLGERIEDPSTAGIKLSVCQVVVVLQAAEAMGPQAHLLHLGPIKPWVALNPRWSHKSSDDEDNADDADCQGSVTRQRPLPVHVGVREQVVCDPHLGIVSEK